MSKTYLLRITRTNPVARPSEAILKAGADGVNALIDSEEFLSIYGGILPETDNDSYFVLSNVKDLAYRMNKYLTGVEYKNIRPQVGEGMSVFIYPFQNTKNLVDYDFDINLLDEENNPITVSNISKRSLRVMSLTEDSETLYNSNLEVETAISELHPSDGYAYICNLVNGDSIVVECRPPLWNTLGGEENFYRITDFDIAVKIVARKGADDII